MDQISANVDVAAPVGEESFADLMKDLEQERDFCEGSVIEALVVGFEGNKVLVDAVLKSRSQIQVEEFRGDDGEIDIKPGDYVKVKVELLDDGRGNTKLSHLMFRREQAWKSMLHAYENNEVVEGYVSERIKGGFSVNIGGLRAFLPASLVDLFQIKGDTIVGRREKFYIERLKKERMSAILNRRLVREREFSGGDLSKVDFKEGDVIDGVVSAIVDYPEFISYVKLDEGVHGVLQRDDISWYRIGNVSDAMAIGDEVKVKVLEMDVENNKVKIGMKQLLPDPWIQVEKSYPVGSRVFGKVIRVLDFGAFVEIEKGVEGLVHTSEMDWLNRNVDPNTVVSAGDEVEVMMRGYDLKNRRISLSLKHCLPNPWEEFQVSYSKGARIKGKINGRQAEIGLFVDLPGNLRGLVHLSDLSYTDPSGRKTLQNYVNGQEIEVYLMAVDVEKERISLGIKQLGEDPYEEFRKLQEERKSVMGTVKKLFDKGARIELNDSVTGFLPVGEICEERIGTPADRLSIGQEVRVRVIDTRDGVKLSIKANDKAAIEESKRKARQEFQELEDKKRQAGTGSFGAMIRDISKGSAASTDESEAAEEETAASVSAASEESPEQTEAAPASDTADDAAAGEAEKTDSGAS